MPGMTPDATPPPPGAPQTSRPPHPAGTSGAITGLAGVLLWTEPDRFAAMARFYTTALGLAPRSAKADFVNFDWDGVRLSIGVHSGVAGPASDPLRVMVNLQVADIQAAHARPVANGVTFSRRPKREPWGGWVATFADPDGNTIQLLELPRPGPAPRNT